MTTLLPRPLHPTVREHAKSWVDQFDDCAMPKVRYWPHQWGILAEDIGYNQDGMFVRRRHLITTNEEGIASHPAGGWLARKVDREHGILEIRAYWKRAQARRWLLNKGY